MNAALSIAALAYATASIVGVVLAARSAIRAVREERFTATPLSAKAVAITAALIVTAVWPFAMIRKAVRG